jgi:hypothetical protein
MLSLFRASGSLFHTAAGVAYADLIIDSHRETWAIRSRQFRNWLRKRYFDETGDALSSAALTSALELLEAKAQFDAPQRQMSLRVAEHNRSIYLDLADKAWQCVEIDDVGWRVISASVPRFRHTAGMLPLPLPRKGASVEALLPFLNLASRNDFVLVVAWLLMALRPHGPYPCWP